MPASFWILSGLEKTPHLSSSPGSIFHCVSTDSLLEHLDLLRFSYSLLCRLVSAGCVSHTLNIISLWISYPHALETSLHKRLPGFLGCNFLFLHMLIPPSLDSCPRSGLDKVNFAVAGKENVVRDPSNIVLLSWVLHVNIFLFFSYTFLYILLLVLLLLLFIFLHHCCFQ